MILHFVKQYDGKCDNYVLGNVEIGKVIRNSDEMFCWDVT
jgi:hypothetical protein